MGSALRQGVRATPDRSVKPVPPGQTKLRNAVHQSFRTADPLIGQGQQPRSSSIVLVRMDKLGHDTVELTLIEDADD